MKLTNKQYDIAKFPSPTEVIGVSNEHTVTVDEDGTYVTVPSRGHWGLLHKRLQPVSVILTKSFRPLSR